MQNLFLEQNFSLKFDRFERNTTVSMRRWLIFDSKFTIEMKNDQF